MSIQVSYKNIIYIFFKTRVSYVDDLQSTMKPYVIPPYNTLNVIIQEKLCGLNTNISLHFKKRGGKINMLFNDKYSQVKFHYHTCISKDIQIVFMN